MRKSFSKFQQTEILGNQDYKCRLCHTRFAKNVRPIYDHIDGDHSNNNIENGQAICSNCHDVKSAKENQKRSIDKKNINFVRCCPFCGKKLKGKDYRDNVGNKLTTDHLSADDWVDPCVGCKSVFKIIRKDPKAGNKKLTGKKVDGVVKHCAHCGVEFESDAELLKANTYFHCNDCNATYGIVIKKYNKKGFWS